jgi:hypothetical protein
MEEENSGGRVSADRGREEWGKRKDGLGKSAAELEKGRRGRRKGKGGGGRKGKAGGGETRRKKR